MCWHLVTWGTSVTVEQPVRLRRRLTEMCTRLATHHGPGIVIRHRANRSAP